MLPLRYSRGWRVAGVAVLLAVFAATLSPALFLQELNVRSLVSIDKWLHGFTFLFLALWFSGQYARRSYWRIVAGLLVFGLFIEMCQRYLSYRTADAADMAANVVGIVAGIGIALAGVGGWSLRIERWIAARREQG